MNPLITKSPIDNQYMQYTPTPKAVNPDADIISYNALEAMPPKISAQKHRLTEEQMKFIDDNIIVPHLHKFKAQVLSGVKPSYDPDDIQLVIRSGLPGAVPLGITKEDIQEQFKDIYTQILKDL